MSAWLRTSPGLPRVGQRPWILRSKGWARLFAAFAGLLVATGTSVAEWFLYEAGESPVIMMIATDVFAGVLAGLLIAGVLGNLVDRSNAMRAQLETIAEMNHHVRNGLQLISLSAIHPHDKEAMATIRLGTDKIEWALREILEGGAVRRPPRRKPPVDEEPRGEIPA